MRGLGVACLSAALAACTAASTAGVPIPAGVGAAQPGSAAQSGAAAPPAGAGSAVGAGSGGDSGGTGTGSRGGRDAPLAAAAEVFNYDRFGAVSVYRSRGRARDVVLFLSGDSGWDGATAQLAQRLADKGAIVAGIDLRHYRDALQKASEACVSPSPDLENLSHYLQSKLGLKKYIEPTLVGYGAGAALAYETLAESPEGLFKSVLTVGFCPDLELTKPLCRTPNMEIAPRLDSAGVQQAAVLSPAKHLPGKWVSLQGELDKSCPAPVIKKFMAQVPGSEMVALPKVAHDYAVPGNWMAQYDAAYARAATLPRGEVKSSGLPAAVADLPLVIVPAVGPGVSVAPVASAMPVALPAAGSGPAAGTGRDDGHGDWFGVFLTGDGGWVGLDKGVSAELARHNIPIVGWDSLKYFWSKRTPEGAAHDLDRVVRTYARLWGRSRVLLIGYSQGADTLPFMVNRLPEDTHRMVGYTTLLGISDNALWEFKVATWLGSPPKGIPTAPELARWSGSPYLCMYGESDGDAACAELTGHDGTVLKLAGGHHFDGGYAEIADDILSRLPQT